MLLLLHVSFGVFVFVLGRAVMKETDSEEDKLLMEAVEGKAAPATKAMRVKQLKGEAVDKDDDVIDVDSERSPRDIKQIKQHNKTKQKYIT